ncbi:hypothetical protein AC249_AIPGENE6319 [Exaiptasia diaphana]|nr:hypothetical protein AC249_AIPGENE6319 [Exaiptasia diaphana]
MQKGYCHTMLLPFCENITEANYIEVVAGWHEASDGRGLCELERFRKNFAMLNMILDDWMPWHSRTFKERLRELGIPLYMYKRYVDDINVVVGGVEPGTRYRNGTLAVTDNARREDSDCDADAQCMRLLRDVGNDIHNSIQIEVDYPSKNIDGKLPILYLKVWIEKRKIVKEGVDVCINWLLHEFYSKEVSSKMVLSSRSALPWSLKRTVLTQEVLRVILNCSPDLPWHRVVEHVNHMVFEYLQVNFDTIEEAEEHFGINYFEDDVPLSEEINDLHDKESTTYNRSTIANIRNLFDDLTRPQKQQLLFKLSNEYIFKDFFDTIMSAMKNLNANKKPNLIYYFGKSLEVPQNATQSRMPLDRIPFGLLSHNIMFFGSKNTTNFLKNIMLNGKQVCFVILGTNGQHSREDQCWSGCGENRTPANANQSSNACAPTNQPSTACAPTTQPSTACAPTNQPSSTSNNSMSGTNCSTPLTQISTLWTGVNIAGLSVRQLQRYMQQKGFIKDTNIQMIQLYFVITEILMNCNL